MFRERYYKSFSVRMEIIAYNAIIMFCHLVEVAIFAISNFLSLFSIAVFNIPISHKIIVLLFLLQSYCFFRYFQIFLTFFHFWRVDLPTIANFVLPVFLSFPAVSCVPVVCRSLSCVLFSSIIHTYIHAYTYTLARGFLDHKFLDIAVIFSRQFLDSIVIFGTQTAIFRLQKHKFSIKK